MDYRTEVEVLANGKKHFQRLHGIVESHDLSRTEGTRYIEEDVFATAKIVL